MKKFLPAWIFIFISCFLTINIAFNGQFWHPSKNPGDILSLKSQIGGKPYGNASSRRFYSLLQILTDMGYKSCDLYHNSRHCKDFIHMDDMPTNYVVEYRTFLDMNNDIVKNPGLKPYRSLKNVFLKTNLNPEGYTGIINYNGPDSIVYLVDFLKYLKEKPNCKDFQITQWHLIEDNLLLNTFSSDWKIQRMDHLANFHIIRKGKDNTSSVVPIGDFHHCLISQL